MNRNMIINGIDNESITMYKELLEYGFEDIVFIDYTGENNVSIISKAYSVFLIFKLTEIRV